MSNPLQPCVLLVGGGETLCAALDAAGYAVVSVAEDEDFYALIEQRRPAAVVISAASPSRDTLEHLALLNRRHPQPIVLFHDGQNHELAVQAMRAGISAYAARDLPPEAVRSLIEVALLHFEQTRALRKELTRAQQTLAERRWVDRAKCRLMETESLSETAAYERLRETAMRERVSLEQAARTVLQAGASDET
ncbi:MAG: ANTAR domain-containing protein [Pseudomonadota bacterium]